MPFCESSDEKAITRFPFILSLLHVRLLYSVVSHSSILSYHFWHFHFNPFFFSSFNLSSKHWTKMASFLENLITIIFISTVTFVVLDINHSDDFDSKLFFCLKKTFFNFLKIEIKIVRFICRIYHSKIFESNWS